MHRTGRRRAAALLVLASGAAPARLVAPRRPSDDFALRREMDGVGGPGFLGILSLLRAPRHVVLDDDRRDRPDRHTVASHPLDIAVETRAIFAVRDVGPVLGEARPAFDGLLVLA